jgi:hypothetical protein
MEAQYVYFSLRHVHAVQRLRVNRCGSDPQKELCPRWLVGDVEFDVSSIGSTCHRRVDDDE